MRIGNLRVYYDVEEEPEPVVYIRAVGVKEHNRVCIGREVIELSTTPTELYSVGACMGFAGRANPEETKQLTSQFLTELTVRGSTKDAIGYRPSL